MPDIRPMTSLPTDFNSMDAVGRIASLLELAPIVWYQPVPGILVKFYDGEGNSCLGVVSEVHDNLVLATPYWPSWESPSDALLTGNVGPLGGSPSARTGVGGQPHFLDSPPNGRPPLKSAHAQ